MTPNKLPPLPDSLEQLIDECRENAQIAGFATSEQRGWDHMADKLEALRQSQSLPAGAVAGLVGKWREKANEPAGTEKTDYDFALEDCATDLEQALQADAREKGEAVACPECAAPVMYECVACSRNNYPADCRDYPAEFKNRLHAAVDAIKVPKMSPLKQELFKAGTVATINAINAALATQPAQASENVEGAVAAHAQRAFKNCIRELRQIQDEAKDYDFDEMTVQALQTGIESIELRLATPSQETASE
ncbi:hypothetical protein [Luteibacter sp.]|uniref:hypothetical protein n=1 Tax=Luteibacter sp. TaxID=1886636 RepID=UPI0028081A96|nr:hypothetical protein [Luteibacter sp.]MDQ8050719.1 hypothetical protein [Luteibacter sp.]